jgi:hypothetical protein
VFGIEAAQAGCREGRTQDVAAQKLEAVLVGGGDAGGGVEGEAVLCGAQGASAVRAGRAAQTPPQGGTGAWAGGHRALHGGGGQGGHEGLLLGEGVGRLVLQQAAAPEQAQDALGGALDEALDVVVGRGGRRLEDGVALCVVDPDAVRDEDVQMGVEAEGGAEALNAGDGAAATVASYGRAGLLAVPGEDGTQEDGDHRAQQGPVPGQAVAQGEG